MKRFAQLTFWFLVLAASAFAEPVPVIAIQPFGKVKAEDLATVKDGITALYAVTVEILPEKPLPVSAWYAPRKRHKADAILDVLSAEMPPRFRKIIGLTAGDISTTNEKGNDWGIFGLGQLGGTSCVVSTFRLRAGKASDKLFHERLVKVVNHELGHNFGRDHCPAERCLMRDAGGKIATVDEEIGKPCADCATRLPMAN